MSDTWNQLEGQIVNGEFPLHRYLGGSERTAVFLTERPEGDLSAKAAIKLVPAGPDNGESQLSRWQLAAGLSHPHLISLYEMGRVELDGVPFLYLVMECAEENLAQVLPERALTPAEARTMLESVVNVLAYLHGKGFVHGEIKPASIMASNDQLKVSNDRLHRAGELLPGGPVEQSAYDPPEIAPNVMPVPRTMSPAGDVWSLGMTLVETLTQHLPVLRTAEQQDPLLPQTLQEPFLDIARHCLIRHPQGRWTVAQIAARLEGRAAAPQANVPAPAPRPVAQRSKPTAKRRSYGLPVAIGVALALVAILAGPKLLPRHQDAMPVPAVAPAVANDQPPVPPAPVKAVPSPPQQPAKPARPTIANERQNSQAPVPIPASIHPETIHPEAIHPEAANEEASSAVMKLPAGAMAPGAVTHQEKPDVPQSARDTIRGAVRVSVKVNVDRSGSVEDADLASPGPSKYFARTALESAKLWKFKPPKVNGRGVLSSWTLQFEFTRDETTVVPTQEMP